MGERPRLVDNGIFHFIILAQKITEGDRSSINVFKNFTYIYLIPHILTLLCNVFSISLHLYISFCSTFRGFIYLAQLWPSWTVDLGNYLPSSYPLKNDGVQRNRGIISPDFNSEGLFWISQHHSWNLLLLIRGGGGGADHFLSKSTFLKRKGSDKLCKFFLWISKIQLLFCEYL